MEEMDKSGEEMKSDEAAMKEEAKDGDMKAEAGAMKEEGGEKMAMAEGEKAMMADGNMHEVMAGDNLWNIAKKPSIYSDAFLWPRIYLENRGMIKNPDLIYPDWVLNVPFGVDLNQHLVTRGQHLSTIAGAVYKDPTKWHRIFRANQSQILDANLIFPAQVLDIPVN